MMNADQAMPAAKAYLALEHAGEPLFEAEDVATTLAKEVERLRAELAAARKDWCGDDEAIKQQALRVLDAAKVEGDSVYVPRMGALAEMMADEMERLRVWNKRWRDVSAKLRLTLAELSDELAEAKAASVLPVEAVDCYTLGEDVEVACKCDEDADRLSGWLRDRMKDKTPPQA